MEPGYRGHFSLANHYLRKSLRLFDPQKPEPAHASIELAAEQMETAVKKMHWIISRHEGTEGQHPRKPRSIPRSGR